MLTKETNQLINKLHQLKNTNVDCIRYRINHQNRVEIWIIIWLNMKQKLKNGWYILIINFLKLKKKLLLYNHKKNKNVWILNNIENKVMKEIDNYELSLRKLLNNYSE